MAGKRIPLPKRSELPEGVYFHREDPLDRQLILQVPDADRADSQTYVVDLDDSAHKCWMEALLNSRQLLTILEYAQHVAYVVTTGYVEEIPDMDAPSAVQQIVARARRDAGRHQTAQRRFFARRRAVPGISAHRRALMGRERFR